MQASTIDERQPLLDANGNPVLNTKGKVTMIPASTWLAKHRSIEALTWDPSKPEFIHGWLAVDGGYVAKPGATSLNFYRPPADIPLGNAALATPWIKHWRAIYPEDADHIIAWLAHRVQRPGDKINHALVLGGAPKIGKDSLLEAVVKTVGEWNYKDIKLNHLVSKNNSFLKAVIVRVNEARDVGEQGNVDRYRLYDHMKDMLASPPATIRVNEKYINEYFIVNCVGVIITTNYRDALYLPADDRRHYVALSERLGAEFPREYWNEFWTWYTEGNGFQHVAALLNQYDLSGFNSKAEPPQTPAFWGMVEADRGPTYSELADAIDSLNRPPALTVDMLIAVAPSLEWMHDITKRKAAAHRLADCQYLLARNRGAKDGLWRINKRRQAIYARLETRGQREEAAIALRDQLNTKAD
jgi:hypothetical protein